MDDAEAFAAFADPPSVEEPPGEAPAEEPEESAEELRARLAETQDELAALRSAVQQANNDVVVAGRAGFDEDEFRSRLEAGDPDALEALEAATRAAVIGSVAPSQQPTHEQIWEMGCRMVLSQMPDREQLVGKITEAMQTPEGVAWVAPGLNAGDPQAVASGLAGLIQAFRAADLAQMQAEQGRAQKLGAQSLSGSSGPREATTDRDRWVEAMKEARSATYGGAAGLPGRGRELG